MSAALLTKRRDAWLALCMGGAFQFPDDIATVPYQEYKTVIESIIPPEDYTIAYDLGGINYLENCKLDRDDFGNVEIIRRERYWCYGKTSAFQLECTKVPQLILITNEPNEPFTMSLNWYFNEAGDLSAYVQMNNDVIVEDIRI